MRPPTLGGPRGPNIGTGARRCFAQRMLGPRSTAVAGYPDSPSAMLLAYREVVTGAKGAPRPGG
eukprot:3056855-Alexandrium_andersonii.AAC.1